MSSESTTSLYEKGKRFLEEEKKKRESQPDYRLNYQAIIDEYRKVTDSEPSDFYERRLVCYFHEQNGGFRIEQDEGKYKISKEALKDYERAESCYINWLKDKEEKEMEKEKEIKKITETTDKSNTPMKHKREERNFELYHRSKKIYTF